ncbi:threonine ammonia-lyase IlvA [Fructilactobacillus sp. Tb1]|uniref:threonine ammonia-lyase IlvA n=1 Tax=Fructilactobacillus sp. Tb1 TaxID=3422304 RepID=UPI003D2C65A5
MDALTNEKLLTQADVEDAADVLKDVVTHTPLQYDAYLSQKYNCNVYLKREDLQVIRSFKLRGAYYAIQQTPKDVRAKGIVCASAGNHAQGVAWTCHKLDIPATIFMPTTTPKQKIDQVKFFGQEQTTIKLMGDTFDDAAKAAAEYCEAHQMTFIAPFDDLRTMAGQGSAAVEIFADAKKDHLKVDYLFSAIGGGGLISGLSAYTKAVSPGTTVVGVEPSGAASMQAAFKVGHPVSLTALDKFVDGAAVKTVGELTYVNAHQFVDELMTVPEGHVCTTILDLYGKEAIVAEPAGALSVSALDMYDGDLTGKTVVCVVSGGNNDIERMQEIKERSLLYEGKQLYFLVNFPQRSGALREFVNHVLQPNDDITRFEYTKKVNRGKGPVLIGVLLGNAENQPKLMENLSNFDPNYLNLKDNASLYAMLV